MIKEYLEGIFILFSSSRFSLAIFSSLLLSISIMVLEEEIGGGVRNQNRIKVLRLSLFVRNVKSIPPGYGRPFAYFPVAIPLRLT